MNQIVEFIKTDNFLIAMVCGMIFLVLMYVINLIVLINTKKNYKKFMKKIGNGDNIQETIEQYMNKINEVESENIKIKNYCEQLDNTLMKCIQKVGIVRYSAFKDTGSDLSFTLALLDEKDNGVVLNGIYSREMSNIYAKPVEHGNSQYTLSEEEKEAIHKAVTIK